MLLLFVNVLLEEEEEEEVVVVVEEISRDKRPRWRLQLLIATATTSQYLNTHVTRHTSHVTRHMSHVTRYTTGKHMHHWHTHMVAII